MLTQLRYISFHCLCQNVSLAFSHFFYSFFVARTALTFYYSIFFSSFVSVKSYNLIHCSKLFTLFIYLSSYILILICSLSVSFISNLTKAWGAYRIMLLHVVAMYHCNCHVICICYHIYLSCMSSYFRLPSSSWFVIVPISINDSNKYSRVI